MNFARKVFASMGRKRWILGFGGEFELACIRSVGACIHALGPLCVA
jgi:hypothetical protein